jgi:hypothetical protein
MLIFDAGGRILVGHRLGHEFPKTSRMARRAHPTRILTNRIGSLLFFSGRRCKLALMELSRKLVQVRLTVADPANGRL